jgi:predicted transcriptional regulator YdeE
MKKIVTILLLTVLGINIIAQETDSTVVYCKDSIKVQDIESFKYIAYEKQGSYSQTNAAFTALWEESVKQFLDYDRSFFLVYYNSPENTPEDSLIWEVGAKLKDDDEIVEPLKKKEWGYKKVAKIKYEGPFDDKLKNAYADAAGWVNENGYQIAGPFMQKHLNRPRPNKDGVITGKVEIWMPIVASK